MTWLNMNHYHGAINIEHIQKIHLKCSFKVFSIGKINDLFHFSVQLQFHP